MALPVVTNASLLCTMGAGTGQLIVSSQTTVLIVGSPAATVQDFAPMSNITPCGMCSSLANPAVASATAAALGVLTPQPCTPSPAAPWTPGSPTLFAGIPALSNDAKLQCAFGGSISIVNPGQTQVLF